MSTLKSVGIEDAQEITEVLIDAFHDYPVMRFIVGDVTDYDADLGILMHYFVMERAMKGEPMLIIRSGGQPMACATIKPPGIREKPQELIDLRESIWDRLGSSAFERYLAFGSATDHFARDTEHYFLDMLGVRVAAQGMGLSRLLTDAVHRMSEEDPASDGVTLTTENPVNVAFYRHLGYQLVGEQQFGPELKTWGFFRPDGV